MQCRVHFNAKVLNHIKFKEWKKARLASDQYLRLKFIKLVPEIIKNSHTLQEIKECRVFERRKINSRWENRMEEVIYYGFIAIINKVRVKVIIKSLSGGSPYFWSVIPFWKNWTDPLYIKTKKIFHEGDLERD